MQHCAINCPPSVIINTMAEDRNISTLNYEAPVDRLHRLGIKRSQVPDTRLGIISCGICGTSIVTASLGFVLDRIAIDNSFMGLFVGAIAAASYLLCIAAGIPLALGGFADEGHRKRFAWIALISNLLWLFGPLVLVMLFWK